MIVAVQREGDGRGEERRAFTGWEAPPWLIYWLLELTLGAFAYSQAGFGVRDRDFSTNLLTGGYMHRDSTGFSLQFMQSPLQMWHMQTWPDRCRRWRVSQLVGIGMWHLSALKGEMAGGEALRKCMLVFHVRSVQPCIRSMLQHSDLTLDDPCVSHWMRLVCPIWSQRQCWCSARCKAALIIVFCINNGTNDSFVLVSWVLPDISPSLFKWCCVCLRRMCKYTTVGKSVCHNNFICADSLLRCPQVAKKKAAGLKKI